LSIIQKSKKLFKGNTLAYIPLIARIDSLPPLPESVLQLEALFAQGDPDIDDLVKIITLDPSLTTDILSKVNAPFYGFSRNIISVLQAITLLGSAQIRAIVLASSIQRSFDVDLSPYGITTSEFSKISTMQSELMFQWYMGVNIDLARIITPIAFLMETGKILIAKDILQNKKENKFLNDLTKYKDISYAENIYTSMNTVQINTLIFKHLQLNDIFWEVMQHIDSERETPQNMQDMVVALQVVKTAVNVQSQFSETSINDAVALIEKNSLNPAPFLRTVKRIKNKYL